MVSYNNGAETCEMGAVQSGSDVEEVRQVAAVKNSALVDDDSRAYWQ